MLRMGRMFPRPRLVPVVLLAALTAALPAQAKKKTAPEKEPAAPGGAQCWLIVTLDNELPGGGTGVVDLCALGLKPDLVKDILSTYGQEGSDARKRTPTSANVLMEVSMRICSRWYATAPDSLSTCANKKVAQMMEQAQRRALRDTRLTPSGDGTSIPAPPALPAANLPPPKMPLYADLEQKELARAQRFCRTHHQAPNQGGSDCLERQVANMREFLHMDKETVGLGDLMRSQRHCESISGEDRGAYFGCMVVQVDRIQRYQNLDLTTVDPNALARAEALCVLRHGDDRGAHYVCLSGELKRLRGGKQE